MMKKKINVIIPVHNESHYLGHCLRSLKRQSLEPSRVIVVDDASSNGSMKIVESFKDDRWLTVSLEREGPQTRYDHSLRYAYVVSQGSKNLEEDCDYIGLLDGDTVLELRYYEKLVKALEDHPEMGLVSGPLSNFSLSGPELGLLPLVWGCNRLFTQECWAKVNEGPLMRVVVSPDTYQNYRAHSLGFKPQSIEDARSFCLRDPGFNYPHIGQVCYLLGYYPWYVLLRGLRKKSVRISVSILAGYLKAWATHQPQYEVKSTVRQLQIERLRRILRWRR